jgi:hypothetical protein
MVTKILVGLAVLIVVVLVVAATRPAAFRVERSATLSASPAALFDHVNNHRKFAVWNPCLPYGLVFEVRPLEPARASAYSVTNENPAS